MSIEPENTKTWVSSLFAKVESLSVQAWQETGCGMLAVRSEKISSIAIEAMMRGATRCRYIDLSPVERYSINR